jgi:3-hydroxy-9,10-secoandrosta-1,3,5(10)-triene-9,17-dione monooxygenase reductase component
MNAAPFDSLQFRRALGCFVTGVTIVTARSADGTPIGMTCNSFTSLSLDPPLVQWSVAKGARSHSAMSSAKHFAVHILNASQHDLCTQFAARAVDRFANVELEVGLHNLPLLTRFHARLECATYLQHDGGDHTILIGRVLRLCEQEGDPLIFYRGALSSMASGR